MTHQNKTQTNDDPHLDVTLTVIAPCYNEQDNIDTLVDRTLKTFDEMKVSAELILVDDGSQDRTWDRIQQHAFRDTRVRCVHHQKNRGIEGGWRSGVESARGELVCLIDADLQNRPEDIAVLLRAYNKRHCDVVQAVRHALDHNAMRILCTRSLNTLLNTVFGTRLRDNKSGFILCRRVALASILQHRYSYQYYQCFIGVAAHARGMTIGEVDTVFERRNHGQSFLANLPLWVCAKIVWEIFKFKTELLREGRKLKGRILDERSRSIAVVEAHSSVEAVPKVFTEAVGGES